MSPIPQTQVLFVHFGPPLLPLVSPAWSTPGTLTSGHTLVDRLIDSILLGVPCPPLLYSMSPPFLPPNVQQQPRGPFCSCFRAGLTPLPCVLTQMPMRGSMYRMWRWYIQRAPLTAWAPGPRTYHNAGASSLLQTTQGMALPAHGGEELLRISLFLLGPVTSVDLGV